MLSHLISSNNTKINKKSHPTTKKSNSIQPKIKPTIPKSSLFISTFDDNDFSLALFNIGGYHKTTHKPVKTVIALYYFFTKKIKSNREYIISNL